jgi:ABC-2 type transport system ATP-binding protein
MATVAPAATHPDFERSIEVRDLVKRYPRSTTNAVDGVSFSVRRGEIFGLLGPNGAGKTTTIGVLTASVQPTSGSASITGVDVARNPISLKQRIAVVPQQSNLDRSLKVREILTFHAAYHSVPRKERETRADALLDELGLGDRKRDRVSRYSGGMAQRLMIARALMHAPDVLFLDEPTNNLDPQSRLFLWDRIRALNQQGLTILLTTHDMVEADQLCQRIPSWIAARFR